MQNNNPLSDLHDACSYSNDFEVVYTSDYGFTKAPNAHAKIMIWTKGVHMNNI